MRNVYGNLAGDLREPGLCTTGSLYLRIVGAVCDRAGCSNAACSEFRNVRGRRPRLKGHQSNALRPDGQSRKLITKWIGH